MNPLAKIKGYDALVVRVAELEAANTALTQANATLTSDAVTLNATITELQSQLTKEKESTDAKASHQAAAIVAGQGCPPVTNGATADVTVEDPITSYNNEKDPVKAAKIYEERIVPLFAKAKK